MYKLGLSFFITCLLFLSSCTKTKDYSEKILIRNLSARVKGLDPVDAGDTYSSKEVARVYEGLLEYHYLKRPYQLQPNLAESMPKISEDGLTYTFKIKKGVLFQNNKCFPDGKGRELKAQDFVYSISRMADISLNSTGWWLLDEKIVGLNEWRKKYNGKKANYDDKIEGLKALDDYTLQFKLKQKYPQFLYSLAMVYTYAVPREAVEMYGLEFLNNPVGTGAFMTGTYTQLNVINYVKNPTYRDVFYPSEGSDDDKKNGLLASAGKKLPLVDKIQVNIVTAASTRFLGFKQGKVDFSEIPKDDFGEVITPDLGLSKVFNSVGIDLQIVPDLDVTYIAFNNDDPLFKNNKKLRQAMSLAYNHSLSNKLFYNSTGVLAQSIIPPGIGGYDSKFKNPFARYDLAKAKRFLAEAGYPEGRGLPTLKYEVTSTTVARQMAEFFQKSMKDIGIKIEVSTNTWPQLANKTKKRQAQMFGMAWLGDYPDAENFLQLLYGPNASPGPNGSNYNDSKFNTEFDRIKNMQPGPKRAALYAKLNQKIALDTPIILGVHRTVFVLKHSWMRNYKYSAFSHGNAKYFDIDLKKKKEMLESGNLSTKLEKKTAQN